MKTKTKLLAEKYLYKVASRFFDEPDTVEQLSEKMVHATLPDGRVIELDDEDYESIDDISPKVAYGEDEEPVEGDVAQGPRRPARYTGAAAKRALKANDAEKMGKKLQLGQEEYDRLAPVINKAVEIYVNTLLDSDDNPIKYKRSTGEWEVPDLNSVTGKKIYAGLVQYILKNVINPYIEKKGYTRLGKVANNIKSAFYIDFGWPDWINKAGMDKDQYYQGSRDYVSKVLKADKNEETNESVKKRLIDACNKALTERYAKRYNVSLKEANRMFIINDK